MNQTIRKMLGVWEADPDLLGKIYAEALPGIPDAQARQLALSFIGAFQPGTQKEHKARYDAYLKMLNAAKAAYPGGEFPKPGIDIEWDGAEE